MSWSHVKTTAEDSVPLNDAENGVLEELRKHIGEEGQRQLTQESMIRYVRGYAFEEKNGGRKKWVEVACAEADKTIKWRKENDINTLEARQLPLWEIFESSWPTGVYGTDDMGHPLIVERFAEFKLEQLVSNFQPEDLTIYQARHMEHVQRRKAKVSDRLGKLIYKHIYIIDASGIGMGVLSYRLHIQAILHVAQYFYPETLWRLVIINTPLLFRAIWNVLSPLVHPITREKIKMAAGKGMKEMKALGIPETQIPASIGGTWVPDPAFEAELAQELKALKAAVA